MAVVGAGMGCLMQITMLVAQNSVEMKDMGVASSSTTLFRTLGSSFGVAIMGALFNSRVQDVMTERAGALGVQGHRAVGAAGRGEPGEVAGGGAGGVPARGVLRHALGVPAGRCGGGAVLVAAVFVKEVPLKGAGPEKGDGEPPSGAAGDGAQ